MPQIRESKDKELLDSFLKKLDHTPFLQSSAWAQFQKEIGNKSYRFEVSDSGGIVVTASAYQIKAKFNSYLYVPWGPVIEGEGKGLEDLVSSFKKIAEEGRLDFIRLEPRIISEPKIKVLEELGFKQNQSFTQPECTSIIDLTKSEGELLSAMSRSTRYNVRSVERKGVKVRKGNADDVETFKSLLKETADRHEFTTDIHADYYKKQYEILHRFNIADIFVAEYQKKPQAAALVVFYGDTATYLHAASSRSQPQIRAPYLLAWKSILEGKNRGYKYFDFWGAAPENAGESHPWSGVTSFKMSFGGGRICYAPVFDLPTSNKYLLAKFIEVVRKPARRILKLS